MVPENNSTKTQMGVRRIYQPSLVIIDYSARVPSSASAAHEQASPAGRAVPAKNVNKRMQLPVLWQLRSACGPADTEETENRKLRGDIFAS